MAAASIGLLVMAVGGLLNPFAKVYNVSTGTKSGCAGCLVPFLLGGALGAARAAHELATLVSAEAWEVAAALVASLVGLGVLLGQLELRVRKRADEAERLLDEGHPHDALPLSRRSAAAAVLRRALAVAPRVADGAPATMSYREPAAQPRSPALDLRSARTAIERAARGRTLLAAIALLVSGTASLFWLAATTFDIPLPDHGVDALTYATAFPLIGAVVSAVLVRQLRDARETALAILQRRPPTRPTEAELLGDAYAVPTRGGRAPEAPIDAESLPSLARRPIDRDIGEGWRYPVSVMRAIGWAKPDVMLWPFFGDASSSYGSGHEPSAIRGVPSVYPREIDVPGAWAPKPRQGEPEWVVARFGPTGLLSTAVRVFETSTPGATYAVCVLAHPEDGEEPTYQTVFARAPQAPMDGAQVLHVPLPAPMKVKEVRVHVVNDGDQWTAIDSVGLVAAEPLPPKHRQGYEPFGPRVKLALWAALIAGFGAFAVWIGPPDPPSVTYLGAGVYEWTPRPETFARVAWGASVTDVSSSHPEPAWEAAGVLGAPDVWPEYGDLAGAWASETPDGGEEWIEVALAEPIEAHGIVIVETLHPGAIAAVEWDDGERWRRLWGGEMPPDVESRRLWLGFETLERVSKIRVVLDTRRVEGWNEIDAIGALPAE